MRRIVAGLFIFAFGYHYSSAQDVDHDWESEYKQNQFKLDKNYAGLGIQLYKPNFGKGTDVAKSWLGVNLVSDFLELKFGMGKVDRLMLLDDETEVIPENPISTDFAYQFAIGVDAPLSVLDFGSQRAYNKVLRGHPTFGANFGVYGVKDSTSYYSKKWDNILFFGLSPGYRIRFPYISVEINYNLTAGFTIGNIGDYYRGVSHYPSITLRADGMKQLLNPRLIVLSATQTSVTDYQSTTIKTGTRTEGGTRIDTYETTTSGTVTVTNGGVGFQDIGPHFGVGPKVSWTPISRSPYMNSGRMFGIAGQGRGGFLDAGFTIEGGKLGHGTRMIPKFKEEGKFKKKVDRYYNTAGKGEVDMANAYFNIGFDISPLFLRMVGISVDKKNVTSFLSIQTGIIFGGHFLLNQRFDDPEAANVYYDQQLAIKHENAKVKFIDPREMKSGLLAGYYMSFQAGALNFTLQSNRYHGAPFASGLNYSISYKFLINN